MIYSLTNDRHNATSEINTLIKCKVKKILPIFAAYGLLGITLRTPTCRLNRMRAVSFFFFFCHKPKMYYHTYTVVYFRRLVVTSCVLWKTHHFVILWKYFEFICFFDILSIIMFLEMQRRFFLFIIIKCIRIFRINLFWNCICLRYNKI